MANKNQPDRWEATWLAVAMALTGAAFLFDKLGTLVRASALSIPAALHSVPVVLVGVGAILLLAEQGALTTASSRGKKQGGRHEL